MKRAVQIVAVLNAIFQIGVGLMCMLGPVMAAAAFKVDPTPSIVILALIRMLGGLLVASGIISAVIARDPNASPMLARAYAAGLLLNVSADVLVITSHELRFDQLAVGMILELALAVLLLGRGRAKTA